MRWDIGIDLGTRNVRMLTEGAPGALAQAAALAVREGAEAPLCFGDAAMALYGRCLLYTSATWTAKPVKARLSRQKPAR